jgi:hypothetical protein
MGLSDWHISEALRQKPHERGHDIVEMLEQGICDPIEDCCCAAEPDCLNVFLLCRAIEKPGTLLRRR